MNASGTMKVMTIAGTRPEWIRQACIIRSLEEVFRHIIVDTGQNYDYELSEQFFEDLDIRKPDYFLSAAGETASETIGRVIIAADRVIRQERPDAIVVLGDTNSCVAAIAGRKNRVPVYHLEAGNRCFDFNVPEELNRRLIDHIADFNLCYTEQARRNLLSEGLPHRRIFVVGSPMNEVLTTFRDRIDASDILDQLSLTPNGYLIASFHREENVDNPRHLNAIVDALIELSERHRVPTIISTHPRARQRLEAIDRIAADERLRFMKPFGFHDYNKLQLNALCAISDSGTISEEAALLSFPAVTIRNAMERPEALDTGSIIITGLDPDTVVAAVDRAISDFRSGHLPPVPQDYTVTNTAQRVVRLVLGTAKLNARWHGLDPIHQ